MLSQQPATMISIDERTLSLVSYGERFKQGLARPGKDRAGAARAMGVSIQAVGQIVNGKTKAATAENNAAAAAYFGCDPSWLASGRGSPLWADDETEYAGRPRTLRPVPIVGTAKLGSDGFFEELQHPTGHGDGWVDGYSADPNAYALRVKGDSMHPAIRHGSIVVVEPNGRCVPGEYVAIGLVDGRKMVKELVIERADEVVVESVNGNQRLTIERAQIRQMHSIAAVVSASKWRPA
jgi:phage repressor protein C with HTH and peptisase S24 domain